MYGALHPKSDVDRLYIPRKEGGRGLISIEDCVELAVRSLGMYAHGSEERLIQASRGDKIDGLEAASVLKRSKKDSLSQGDSLCRVCRKVDESIDHIVSGCSKLAQKDYKRSHDNLGKIVHWKLARKCHFEAGHKWYEHEPESDLENEDYKILWDFSIQTDHVIEARRPDLVLVNKKERSCKVIDFAVPYCANRTPLLLALNKTLLNIKKNRNHSHLLHN